MTLTGGGLLGLLPIILIFIIIYFIIKFVFNKKEPVLPLNNQFSKIGNSLSEDDEDEYIIEEDENLWSVRIPKEAQALFDEGFSYYPHKDTEKALSCFMEGFKYISKAPSDIKVQRAIANSDIGHATWAAWVSMDILDKPSSEMDYLFEIVRRISPVTFNEISDRITESNATNNHFEQIAKCAEVLDNVNSYDDSSIRSTIKVLIEACEGANAYWELKDYGISLYKQGKKEIAWDLFNHALSVAKNYGGNTTPIYNAMGQTQKSENNYKDAAKYFLMACIYSGATPPKVSLDNLRITLKKALPSEDPVKIRDILLSKIEKEEPKAILELLESYFHK
jgi:tetratricopeptide (TPR) repeat protein